MSIASSQCLSDYEDAASTPASSRTEDGSLNSSPSRGSSLSSPPPPSGSSPALLSRSDSSTGLHEGGYHSDGRASESGSDFSANVSDIGGLSQCSEDVFSTSKDVESPAESGENKSALTTSDDESLSEFSHSSYTGVRSASSALHTTQNDPSTASVFLTQAPKVGDSKHFKGRLPSDTRKHKASVADTDLMLAVKNGDTSLVKKLLKSGKCNLNATDASGRTVLHIACSFGRLEIVQMLLDEDVNCDACSLSGQTPLHEACIGGHEDVLHELLAVVCDLDMPDAKGLSAAHYCAMNCEVDCLNILCNQGCDICLEDQLGRTGVHLAAMRNHAAVMHCLMERGMELDPTDHQGRTPAHYAAQHAALDCLKMLAKNAVDMTAGDEAGDQPVHEASRHNNLDCLRFLLRRGASMSAMNKEGKTLLHMAARSGSLSTLHWLLDNGAKPNQADSCGRTALHLAGAGGHAQCFNCLLQHGAIISQLTHSGDNPLDVARRHGNPRAISRAVDGSSSCSMCNDSAAKQRLQLASAVSPIHTKIKKTKETLFEQPPRAAEKERHLQATTPKSYAYSGRTSSLKSTLPKRNIAAKYYGPVAYN